jgi:hypothetical protein
MVSASVAVWVSEPEVPVNVMVGVADAVAIAAVKAVVAEGCAGVRVSVDGLAVTPEGRPEIETETEPLKELSDVAVTVMGLLVVPALRESEPGETARVKSGAAAWMVSARVAVWVREPEVPVKVMVGAAEGVVSAAAKERVAEGCAGDSVSVDGFAVTPEGRPEIETEMEPLKELSEVAVTVMALLVVPALRESEPGDTAREKSGVGLGGAVPPQVVSREMPIRDAMSPSALGRGRMRGSVALHRPM